MEKREPTIEEMLAEVGCGSRPSESDGRREVFHLLSGDTAGLFDAFEAVAFAKTLKKVRETYSVPVSA